MNSKFDIMIIDDERSVRERLKSLIDWDRLLVRLACEAQDSDTAEELYLTHHPKIIITDINIPFISGLELARELQKEDPELRFIVITGYNDFSYAQQTVDLNAVSLLAKPVTAEDINGSIAKAISQIETAREKSRSMAALKRLVDKNLTQMQELFVANLIRNGTENPELLSAKLNQLEISFTAPCLTVMLVALHPSVVDQGNWETLIMVLREELTARLTEAHFEVFAFVDTHFRLNCVVSMSRPSCDDVLEETMIRLQEYMQNIHGVEIWAGIGLLVKQPAELKESYNGALTALNYQSYVGVETITLYKNLERTDIVFYAKQPILNYLLQQFRTGDYNAVAETFGKRSAIIRSYSLDSERALRNFFFEYVTSITEEAMRLGLNMEQMERYSTTVVRLFQNTDVDGCIEDILELTDYLIKQLQARKTYSSNHLIAMAKEYVEQHIADKDLSLDTLAGFVGLSRIYFCKLFHQVEGIGFSNYLKNKRVEMAKELLRTTNMKVYEISDAVGYFNAKYFSYVFKQTVGLTPLEYQRASAHKGGEGS